MSTQAFVPFRTSFGMFVPCDLPTYRKLKRIRHLAGFAEAERRRWDRSQRRLPQNRAFKRRRRPGRPVREPVDQARMIFSAFYELVPADASFHLPADARLGRETDLYRRFFEAYSAARHPKPEAAGVSPLPISIAEIDALLTQIELWNLKR